MKTIKIPLEDSEYEELKADKEKKNCTWREYLALAKRWEHNPDQYQNRSDDR